MNAILRKPYIPFITAALLLTALVATSGTALASGSKVSLSGDQEVPPVRSSASAKGEITVSKNMSVKGSIKTKGIVASAAHVHEGASGVNGPVVFPLTQTSKDTWSVPQGTRLNNDQYKSYKAGQLYVNVHSAAHPDGEIRGQLK